MLDASARLVAAAWPTQPEAVEWAAKKPAVKMNMPANSTGSGPSVITMPKAYSTAETTKVLPWPYLLMMVPTRADDHVPARYIKNTRPVSVTGKPKWWMSRNVMKLYMETKAPMPKKAKRKSRPSSRLRQ